MPSRRRFLQAITLFSGCLAAEEPFDALPAGLWKNARLNGLIMIHRPAPADLSSRTRIVPANEPGEALVVKGQVFAPDGRSPAPGVTVYAYNTDAQGYYGANHTEYPPRLYGWMKSDSAGSFELQTIRPGRYPGMHVAAHVHFVLWGGGYPLQCVDELRFAGDSYLSRADMEQDAAKGAFRSIQPLNRDAAGVWHCAMKIKLASQTTYHE